MFIRSFFTDQFNRLFVIMIAILLVICSSFLTLNLSQSIRLRQVEVDPVAVTQERYERVTFFFNQPLTSVNRDQITVEPSVAFLATTTGNKVSLQFSKRLEYSTQYTITIKDVAAVVSREKKARFHHQFTTAQPRLFYLHRQEETSSNGSKKFYDQLIHSDLSGSRTSVVYAATAIQDFAISGDQAFIAFANPDKTSSFVAVDIKTRNTKKINLPSVGTIKKVQVSPDHKLVGYSFTSTDSSNSTGTDHSLISMSTDATTSARPIPGLTSGPLQVIDWRYATDSTTIVAQSTDGSLLLVDSTGKHQPKPLGRFTKLGNLSVTGTKLTATQSSVPIILDVITQTRTTVEFKDIEGMKPYSPNLILLTNDEGYLAQLMLYREKNQQFLEYYKSFGSGGEKLVFQSDPASLLTHNFHTSPNDQYLALEQSQVNDPSFASSSDNSRPLSLHTQLVEVKSGRNVRQIPGFAVAWS